MKLNCLQAPMQNLGSQGHSSPHYRKHLPQYLRMAMANK